MKKLKLLWIAIFLVGIGFRTTYLLRPVDRTEWRESDMASIARNYYRNGMHFAYPQVDWGGNGPGYTESEFPVYPFLIALTYKAFGIWEPAGRLISFLFSLGTLLVFFKLCRYLFKPYIALCASAFFSASPLLMVTSDSIQPESIMFFFYVASVLAFIKWIDDQSFKYFVLTFFCVSMAILLKITAINIGIMFLVIVISKLGWKALLKPVILILGICCVVPVGVWYIYSHSLFLHYGNSLGISNEYAWIGLDFFKNPYFIKGVVRQELVHVWTFAGPVILLFALLTAGQKLRDDLLIPASWFFAAGIFYLVAIRTTADNWAYYYHIFSVPSVSMVLGISVSGIFEKYYQMPERRSIIGNSWNKYYKSVFILTLLFLLLSSYLYLDLKYLVVERPELTKRSQLYMYRKELSMKIPQGSLILASGGTAHDDTGYPVAFNASYFFYWLDRKGFSIAVEDQSIENVVAFKEKGARYFVAETRKLDVKQEFEMQLRNEFKVAFEKDGVVLFDLNIPPREVSSIRKD